MLNPGAVLDALQTYETALRKQAQGYKYMGTMASQEDLSSTNEGSADKSKAKRPDENGEVLGYD